MNNIKKDIDKENIETKVDNKVEEINENVSTNDSSEDEINFEDVLIKLNEENNKLKEDYLRALAEVENTKRRSLQEIEKNNKYAINSFAKNLLSVADNLQRAINSVPSDEKEKYETFLTGMELTQSELLNVFKKFGIEKMNTLDNIFDANYHQVVQEVPDDKKPAGTVIAEVQTGFMINDRILREAMVVVTK